jgi:SAM-dependent methyltransferase
MQTRQPEYPVDLAEITEWILTSTPAGGRVLEIGSGDGAVTERLVDVGIDAIGIDPHATDTPHTRQIALEEFDAAPFDVVFASVSLHHLADPARTVEALRRLSKPGTVFLVREFDRLLVDHEPTLRWWYHQRLAQEAAVGTGDDDHGLGETFEAFHERWRQEMEHHVLPWATVRDLLHEAGFTTTAEWSSPYLYRWGLTEPARAIEEDLIARGAIHEVGVRWAGRRD